MDRFNSLFQSCLFDSQHRSSLCLDFKSGLLFSQVFYHNLENKYEKIYPLELRDKSQKVCPVLYY